MSDKESVLVVDDDDTFRDRLVRAFQARGLDAVGAPDLATAKALAEADSPELAVVDLRLAGSHGLDVVAALLAIDHATRVVVLTGYGSIATAIEAMRIGAVHYLQKPADADQILAALRAPDGEPQGPREPLAVDEVPSLARVEWEHIQRVMHDCDNNISKAARLLGLHRRSLQRKLGKLPGR